MGGHALVMNSRARERRKKDCCTYFRIPEGCSACDAYSGEEKKRAIKENGEGWHALRMEGYAAILFPDGKITELRHVNYQNNERQCSLSLSVTL